MRRHLCYGIFFTVVMSGEICVLINQGINTILMKLQPTNSHPQQFEDFNDCDDVVCSLSCLFAFVTDFTDGCLN